MNVIKRMTLSGVLLNKKRTVTTILAIVMSAALICGTAGIAYSALMSLQESAIRQTGDFHVTITNVPAEKRAYVTENDKVERYFLSRDLGYAVLPDSLTQEKPYLFVRALDDTALHGGFGIRLLSGRLPENENELLISEHLFSVGGVDMKTGGAYTLKLGQRVRDDGVYLGQDSSYLSSARITDEGNSYGDPDSVHTETLQNTKLLNYTVVGVMARPDMVLEGYVSPGFTAYTYLPESQRAGDVNLSVTFKNARYYRDYLGVILSNFDEEPYVFRNVDLLEYQGALSGSTISFLATVSAVVILIIMATSVFVIRNSFAISVAEKRRLYGILSGVGATPRQIRKSVLFEGFLYGVVGIPLGLLSGVGAIWLLLKIVSAILGDVIEDYPLRYHLSGWVLLAGAVLTAVTILFSALIPAVRASKIPAVEAIRGARDVKDGRRAYRVSPLIKLLFGIGGVIAAKNLKRARKKYRTTVVSLVLSVSVFISLSAFVTMAKESIRFVRADRSFNVCVFASTRDVEDGSSGEKLLRLAQMTGAQEKSVYRTGTLSFSVKEYGSETLKKDREDLRLRYDEDSELKMTEEEKDAAAYTGYCDLYVLNDDYFRSYLTKLGIKTPSTEAAVVLDESRYLSVKAGEALVCLEPETKLTLTHFTDVHPMGLEEIYSMAPAIFISERYFDEKLLSYAPFATSMYLNVSDADAAEQSLAKIMSSEKEYAGYSYVNIALEAKQESRVILVAEIFLYGFISVITLIGVTNVFNTVTTNMLLRSREFAMLRSIGMTDREFSRMIRLESLLYGLKSLLIGIPLGIAGSLALYIPFKNEFDLLRYRFPVIPIVLSIVVVFLIVALTMRYSVTKINRQNVIETIRSENT